MADELLRLNVGDTLQLQPVESPTRYSVRVIGFLPGHSLVVTTPRRDTNVLLIREGQSFAARMLVKDRVCAFTTSVIKVSARPYPYLHLTYPEVMESVIVRKAPRARTYAIASARNRASDTYLSGHLVDMSITGARLACPSELGAVGDTVELVVQVQVGDLEESLLLAANIRNEQQEAPADDSPDAARFSYGLEFQTVGGRDALALYAFVYSRLAEHEQG